MSNPLKLKTDTPDTFRCTQHEDDYDEAAHRRASLPNHRRMMMSRTADDVKNERTPKAKKPKPPTKAQRWADACTRALAALEELEEMRSDWEDTYGNVPDSLQSSPYGEKLSAMADLDIQSALSTVQEAEGLDTPLGFGRD